MLCNGQWWAATETAFGNIFFAYTRATATQDRSCVASPPYWQRQYVQKSNPAYLCAFLRQCMWTQPETGLASLASYFLSCGFLYFSIWLLCQTLAWILWTCNVSKELPASGHFCWFNITVYMHLLSLLLIVGQMLLLFYSYWVVYCTEELPQKYLPNQLLRPVSEGPQIWYNTDRMKQYPVWAKTDKSFVMSFA